MGRGILEHAIFMICIGVVTDELDVVWETFLHIEDIMQNSG